MTRGYSSTLLFSGRASLTIGRSSEIRIFAQTVVRRSRRLDRGSPYPAYRQTSSAALALLLALFPGVLFGQVNPLADSPSNRPVEIPPAESDGTAEERAEVRPDAGLWPSDRLLRIMLTRWVEESCEEFDMDEAQRSKVRERLVEAWSEFLSENRPALQPLINEFLEMRLDVSPPPKEKVQDFAKRAMPAFEKTRKQIESSHDMFREVLRPGQRLTFEAEAFQMGIGLELARQRLEAWERGEIDPKDIWEGPAADQSKRREMRRQRIERQRAARRELADRTETDQIAIEMTAWEKYVADFTVRFSLDESQKTSALSFLRELQARALDHRDRHRDEIDAMERSIRDNTGDEKEVAEIKKQLLTLYGPVDEMFQELKDRLEKLLTDAQRAASGPSEASHDAAAPPVSQPAPSQAPTLPPPPLRP